MSVAILKAKARLKYISNKIRRIKDKDKLKIIKTGLKEDLSDIKHDLKYVKNPITKKQLNNLKTSIDKQISNINRKLKIKKRR